MEKNLREIYDKIYKDSGFENEVNNNRKRLKEIFLSYGISFFIMFFNLYLGMICFILVFICMVIPLSKDSGKTKQEKEFNNLYKQKIITPILEESFDGIRYIPNEGICLQEYLEAEYLDSSEVNEKDKFISKDHIILPIVVENKNVGDMHIYNISIERIKNKEKSTIYVGTVGSLALSKNVKNKVKTSPKFRQLISLNEMQIEKFEEYFNIFSDDKILAMRIFTVDVMVDIIQICNENNIICDINIIDSKLYIRIHSVVSFDPWFYWSSLNNDAVIKLLQRDIQTLEAIGKVAKIIYKVVDNMEI